jgi:hypothetical protein
LEDLVHVRKLLLHVSERLKFLLDWLFLLLHFFVLDQRDRQI